MDVDAVSEFTSDVDRALARDAARGEVEVLARELLAA